MTTRRHILTAAAALPALALPAHAQTDGATRVARVPQVDPFPVNAYLVEGSEGVVLVDGLLTVPAAQALAAAIAATGKPLRAALLTHPHPDHYAGLAIALAGADVPIVATAGVNDVVRRDDAAKDALIGGMFGPLWPATRAFPGQIVADGDRLDFGPGLTFTVMDIGPAESHHDSLFLLDAQRPVAFAGDVAYGLMHAYMADAHNAEWTAALDRLASDLPEDLPLLIGHGAPVTPGFLRWQRHYLSRFDAALRAADWSAPDTATVAVMAELQALLPDESLAFLAQLSVEPNARALGLWR